MTTSKSYDNLNRLTSISSANASAAVLDSHVYAYNNANQRTAVTNTDSSRWAYNYDPLGQVTSGKKYWSDNTVVAGQQFQYTFDDIGNRTTTTAGGSEWGNNLRYANYSVNALNQYSSRTVPAGIDVVGDATNTATVTVNNQGTYRKGAYYRKELAIDNSASPAYQSVTNLAVLQNGTNSDIITNAIGNVYLPKTPEQFTYDLDGNLTSDGHWTNIWDAENHLISMQAISSVPSGAKQKLDFIYDYHSRRAQKIVSTWNGSVYFPQYTNKFVYDRWNLIAEVNGPDNALIRSYMWGTDLSGSMQGAGGVGGLLAISSPISAQFTCFDGNGNITALIDSTNSAISAQYEYGPFGEIIRSTGPMAKSNPFRFSTKYQDDETDLLYYGYRYYSPSMGRWLSRDPVHERGGFNLYGFVRNNGVHRVDLFGLSDEKTIDGPSSAIFSWLQTFDRDTINLKDFTPLYTELAGKASSNPQFEAWIYEGLRVLDLAANPDPGNTFDNSSVENWGSLKLQVSIKCNCQGKIVDYNTPLDYNTGYTRYDILPKNFGKYKPHTGDPAEATYQGGVGQSFLLVTASLNSGLDKYGEEKVWNSFFPDLAGKTPSSRKTIEYILRCDKTYEVHYSASNFPSHRAYLNDAAVATSSQSGYASFAFSGGLGPVSEFHVERGSVAK